MPIFLASLLGGLVAAAGSFVGRALISLFVGFVSYEGIDLLLGTFSSAFSSHAAALSPMILGVLGTLKIGTCFNIITSAIVIRLTIGGLTSGAVKKAVFK
jgi:hypothetical protein